MYCCFSTENDFDALASITFSTGAIQGSVACVNITFIDDDVTEQLECFTFALTTIDESFIPVCIEDNDGRL